MLPFFRRERQETGTEWGVVVKVPTAVNESRTHTVKLVKSSARSGAWSELVEEVLEVGGWALVKVTATFRAQAWWDGFKCECLIRTTCAIYQDEIGCSTGHWRPHAIGQPGGTSLVMSRAGGENAQLYPQTCSVRPTFRRP